MAEVLPHPLRRAGFISRVSSINVGFVQERSSRLRMLTADLKPAKMGSPMDDALARATEIIIGTLSGDHPSPQVQSFFDEATFTATHVVCDPVTRHAAVIDPVLDYDASNGRTFTKSAEAIIAHIEAEGLTVDWLLETHAHADHLTAAQFLKKRLGGKLAIGRGILEVQEIFGGLFNVESDFPRDGSQFDQLFDDGDAFMVGRLKCSVLHLPGHTPADLAYVVGDTAFCGDTLFMPDYGTARADFPGGSAERLYESIRRLLRLPGETRVMLCHDYKAPGRNTFAWETTIEVERTANVHVRDGIGQRDFVAARNARDATLGSPRLLLPSVQFNMRGGAFPPLEDNGVAYFKIPLNLL